MSFVRFVVGGTQRIIKVSGTSPYDYMFTTTRFNQPFDVKKEVGPGGSAWVEGHYMPTADDRRGAE